MKYLKIFITIICALFTNTVCCKQNNLNIYTWGNFLPNEIVQIFTKETGIKVNISEYDSNETMFSKLKTLKNPEYDIILPSNPYVEKMVKHKMLQPIDKTKLGNFNHLKDFFLNRNFDPGNTYSIPYLWGSTIIIINTKYINKNAIKSWKDLCNTQYKNQVLFLNDMHDVFSIALLSLGYSVVDTNPKHLEKAYLRIKEFLPNIKIFSTNSIPNIYIDEDAIIGMTWSGDYKLAKKENKNLEYIYPKDGFVLWVDNFVILKNAPNPNNAHKFINFMLRPEVAKIVNLALGHGIVNKTTLKQISENMQNDPIINPNEIILKRGEFQKDLDIATLKLYQKYWEKIKLSH